MTTMPMLPGCKEKREMDGFALILNLNRDKEREWTVYDITPEGFVYAGVINESSGKYWADVYIARSKSFTMPYRERFECESLESAINHFK